MVLTYNLKKFRKFGDIAKDKWLPFLLSHLLEGDFSKNVTIMHIIKHWNKINHISF